MARVRLPALDALYDKLQALPDGPERLAAFREAERLAVAYMPYKFTLNRVSLDMTQKRVVGYRRPVFWQDWWQYVDIDDRRRAARAHEGLSACDERGVDRRSFAIGSAGLIAAARAPAARRARRPPPTRNVAARACSSPPRPASTRRRSATCTRARVTAHIFEALLRLRPLARAGASCVPLTADGDAARSRPTSASGRCSCSPASASPTTRRSRASRASSSPQDYVYAFKRIYDPAIKSPALRRSLDEEGILGLSEMRARALRDKKPFDYDSVAEGLRALDRYTLQFKLRQAAAALRDDAGREHVCGAVAREVVEAYGDDIMAHPVGTGPYPAQVSGGAARASCSSGTRTTARCATTPSRPPTMPRARRWSRASRAGACRSSTGVEIVDRRGEASRAGCAFLNGQADFARVAARVRRRSPMPERQARAEPRQAAASALQRYLNPDVTHVVLQHGGPGGRRLHARRRSRCAARSGWRYDIDYEIRIIRRGQAIPAQAPMRAGHLRLRRRPCAPRTAAYDAGAREGAARHLRLRRPQRRRLARAARRLAAGARHVDASRSRSTASTTRTGSGARPRSASAWSSRPRSGPST